MALHVSLLCSLDNPHAHTALDYLHCAANTHLCRTTVRRVRKETKYVEREPLAKSLADKLGHTEEEVQQLKTRLSHASQQ